MHLNAYKGDPKRHYRHRIVIEGEQVLEVSEDRDYEEFHTYQSHLPVVMARDSTITVRAKGLTIQQVPGEKLWQLVDLGYSEEQGVTMLDALEA